MGGHWKIKRSIQMPGHNKSFQSLVFLLTQLHLIWPMEQSSILYSAKFDCPVAHQNCSLKLWNWLTNSLLIILRFGQIHNLLQFPLDYDSEYCWKSWIHLLIDLFKIWRLLIKHKLNFINQRNEPPHKKVNMSKLVMQPSFRAAGQTRAKW